MKREREVDSVTMANYLMLLSRGGGEYGNGITTTTTVYPSAAFNNNNRVFECKTCNRQFSSFQALGGHRASHKKPRLMAETEDGHQQQQPPKPKTHECSICGLEFAIGQALGGHMRRHRTAAAANSNSNGNVQMLQNSVTTTSTGNSSSIENDTSENRENGNNRVLFLDLNLTPFENDLEFLKIGQPIPLVGCFN